MEESFSHTLLKIQNSTSNPLSFTLRTQLPSTKPSSLLASSSSQNALAVSKDIATKRLHLQNSSLFLALGIWEIGCEDFFTYKEIVTVVLERTAHGSHDLPMLPLRIQLEPLECNFSLIPKGVELGSIGIEQSFGR